LEERSAIPETKHQYDKYCPSEILFVPMLQRFSAVRNVKGVTSELFTVAEGYAKLLQASSISREIGFFVS
jgi:hypothetical protein